MKKRIFGAVFALLFAGQVFAQDTRITEKELPVVVKKNLTKYFGKKKITTIIKDVDITKVEYNVYFDDQTEVEFRSNGEIKEVKSYNGISQGIVPAKISSYVKNNYPNEVIIKWSRGINKHEIELSNGLDLEFTSKGDFFRIDD